MLHAQLGGKLRHTQENLEDLLTSNVFGVLDYLDAHAMLVAFLRAAEGPDADALRDALDAPIASVAYEFWPSLQYPGCDRCEPDVLLRLAGEHSPRALVLVEAKYRSGKSSEASGDEAPPHDQLAREWDNLRHRAREVPAFVVYVTADFSYPAGDIETSRAELNRKGLEGRFAWVSWRAFARLVPADAPRMLRDVAAVLRNRYGLVYFERISAPTAYCAWRFAGDRRSTTVSWDWIARSLGWRLGESTPARGFSWNAGALPAWRWLR